MTLGTYLTKKKWRTEFLEMQFNEAKVTFYKGTVTPKWNAVKKLSLRRSCQEARGQDYLVFTEVSGPQVLGRLRMPPWRGATVLRMDTELRG